MEDIIHLLPDSVANQIAAGEVVQRPASIVKELVENSLDAGATLIQVLVIDGGRTSVQVIDDGKGMSETDARLAFERHATSKIIKASDLFALTTMGFRGEALASIAAVAQVELKTRRPEDELGTFIRISGSKVEQEEPIACPVGSNFSVNNLFFNVPARRKFLKSNQTELSNVAADFERIVLTHPEVHFELYNNGVEMYKLPQASLRQRIVDVFGKKINPDILPIEVETSLVTITGYVAKPETSKRRGSHQYFFVNGRYMRHPYFHSAVMHAYEDLIPVGEHVSYFIYLSVEPSTIDVNVHPTKTEIKFDNEQPIWQVLTATVREALGKYSNVPTIDFDTQDKPDIPVPGLLTDIPQPPKAVSTDYNPFRSSSSNRQPNVEGWESLYVDNIVKQKEPLQQTLWNENPQVEKPDLSTPHFQYKGRYIVKPTPSGIMLIDQHRAHVRVLFEQYMENLFQQQGVSQGTLFPEIAQFTKQETLTLEDIQADLESIGFELTNLGGGSYSITGVPSGIEGVNPIKLLHDLVASAMETGSSVKEKVHKAIALTMARAAAIVYGQVLSDEEIKLLLERLFDLSTPKFTPDGMVVYVVVDNTTIDKQFK
ncbi:MAG: DNA mismatch repair endonuclease MutL [Bacteroidaceae bacterium]|nr:DNA mismatch repair endonuclease MutL [Bacteroidaceae bacterium]